MKEKIKESCAQKYLVPALYRGLGLIERLSASPEGLLLSEIKGIPPATVYRMLMTLVYTGYAVQNGERYCLTRKLLSLAYSAVDESSLQERALPNLRALRNATGETALVAALYGTEGVVLEQEVSNSAVKVSIRIGHHFPLHASAPGKAILAFLPDAERKEILDHLKFTVFTKNTIHTRKSFEAELKKIRKEGIAFDNGEELNEIRCVAAPVFGKRDYPEGAVWISGPASRLPSYKLKQYADFVRKCAEKTGGC